MKTRYIDLLNERFRKVDRSRFALQASQDRLGDSSFAFLASEDRRKRERKASYQIPDAGCLGR
jgi:hypothetical protein